MSTTKIPARCMRTVVTTTFLLTDIEQVQNEKNLLPSAESFYGRLETIQGRGRDGIDPC